MDIGLKNDCEKVDPNEGYLLTEKQYKAIELLLEGNLPNTKIAEELGINRRTLQRWKNDKRFQAELQECTNENKRQTQNYINSKSLLAAKKLWALTDCGDNRTKYAALQDWLNRSIGKPQTKMIVEDNRDTQEDFDIQAALERIDNNEVPIAISSSKAS